MPDWWVDEDDAARSFVYLITFAALVNERTNLAQGEQLRDPSTMTREEMANAVFDAVAHPVLGPEACPARGGRPRTQKITPEKLVAAREKHHTSDKHHGHVALKLSAKSRFMPYKLALRRRSHLASHWSTTHAQFWSAVRYLVAHSDRKPVVDLHVLTWPPEMNMFEEAQEPFNAKALKQRREAKALAPPAAAEPPKKKAKAETFTKLDFTALVLSEKLTSANKVMVYVQKKGSVIMQAFVNKHQRRLGEYIDDAFAWGRAQASVDAEEMSDWGLIEREAKGTCQCGGGGCLWWERRCVLRPERVGR